MPTDTPTQPNSGVIHDIGYRSYDGPRLGRGYARRSLFTQSLRGAYGLGRSTRSKVTPMLLLAVMTVPAAIIVAVTIVAEGEDLPLTYTEYTLFLQPLIGLYLASQAPQAVSMDLRFRTVPLYFSRPIERRDYVLAKYAALTVALLLFTGLPLLVMYLGALLAKLDFTDQTTGFAQGLVGCALLCLLLAGLALVLAALTPRRGFGVAAVIGALTIPYGAVQTLMATAYAADSTAAVPWLALGSPNTLLEGVAFAFLDTPSSWIGGAEPSTTTALVLLLATLGLIAGSYAVLMRRYRKAGL